MKKALNHLLLAAIFFTFQVKPLAQVTSVLVRVNVPEIKEGEKGVFIAGSFNYWHAGDTLYRMVKTGKEEYSITIPVFEGKKYEYKYTLGSWDKVEISHNDSDIQNRRFISASGTELRDTVARWKLPPPPKDNHQLNKVNAMKDSVLNHLQPELDYMLGLLKSYVENFLMDKPSKKIHRRLDKKAAKKLGYAYREITGLLWSAMATFSPEQKKSIRKQLEQPVNNDFLNTFLSAFNKELEGK